LHASAKTDANGSAECKELALSRLGGDKFRIGAYLDQDAHLAKYVDDHAELKKKKPSLSDELQVWRKAFIQISRNKTSVLQARDSTVAAFESAYTLVREVDETQYDPGTIAGLVEHPKWQFESGDASGKKIILRRGSQQGEVPRPDEGPPPPPRPRRRISSCAMRSGTRKARQRGRTST
jgi:hypothetical protein